MGFEAVSQADGGAASSLPLAEACEAVGVRPKAFRQLLSEFAGVVEGPQPGAGGQVIPRRSVELLRRAVELRGLGRDDASIRAEVSRLAAADGAAGEGAGQPPDDADLVGQVRWLHAQVDQLRGELRRSEERRVQDRDRLLTALMKVQRELQAVRFEMAARASRRERRARGWLGRLWSSKK